MIQYVPDRIQEEFQRNLKDWAVGGPKEGGWTRAGEPCPIPEMTLTGYRINHISIEDALSKNPVETAKWHIPFLEWVIRSYGRLSEWKETTYYEEYLKPRYDETEAHKRAFSFIELFNDIRRNGVKQKVWIAHLNMPACDYFRFNGCHRVCAAKVLGAKTVAAYIFSTSID